jgi:hypothetical protein
MSFSGKKRKNPDMCCESIKLTMETQRYSWDEALTIDQQRAHHNIWIRNLHRKLNDSESRCASLVSLLTEQEMKVASAEKEMSYLKTSMRDWLQKAEKIVDEEHERAVVAEKKCVELQAKLLLFNSMNYEQI